MKKTYPGHMVFSFHGNFQLPDFWTGKPAEALRLMADYMESEGNAPVADKDLVAEVTERILDGQKSAQEAYMEYPKRLVAGFGFFEANEPEELTIGIGEDGQPTQELLLALKAALESGKFETNAPPEVVEKMLKALDEGKVRGPEAEPVELLSDGSATLFFADLTADFGPGRIMFSMHENNGVFGLMTTVEAWERMKKIVDEQVAAMPRPQEGLL